MKIGCLHWSRNLVIGVLLFSLGWFQTAFATEMDLAESVDTYRAVVTGDLCRDLGPEGLTASGNRLEVRFDGQLRIASYDDIALRQSCLIRIPVRIPQGLTVSKLSYRMEGLLQKPSAGDFSVGMKVGLYGWSDGFAQRKITNGVAYNGYLNIFEQAHLKEGVQEDLRETLCNPERDEMGLLNIDLIAFARSQGAGDLRFQLPAHDTAMDLWIETESCY